MVFSDKKYTNLGFTDFPKSCFSSLVFQVAEWTQAVRKQICYGNTHDKGFSPHMKWEVSDPHVKIGRSVFWRKNIYKYFNIRIHKLYQISKLVPPKLFFNFLIYWVIKYMRVSKMGWSVHRFGILTLHGHICDFTSAGFRAWKIFQNKKNEKSFFCGLILKFTFEHSKLFNCFVIFAVFNSRNAMICHVISERKQR